MRSHPKFGLSTNTILVCVVYSVIPFILFHQDTIHLLDHISMILFRNSSLGKSNEEGGEDFVWFSINCGGASEFQIVKSSQWICV